MSLIFMNCFAKTTWIKKYSQTIITLSSNISNRFRMPRLQLKLVHEYENNSIINFYREDNLILNK